MSLLLSNKAPLTFSDVVACFSEEEWTLLHEWQNELYNNVMKEIHQAMNSLGPLIANFVFSLSAKEKEDVCFMDNTDSQIRHREHKPSTPVVSFIIKEEGDPDYTDYRGVNAFSADFEISDADHVAAEGGDRTNLSSDGCMDGKKNRHLVTCHRKPAQSKSSTGKVKSKEVHSFAESALSTGKVQTVNDQKTREEKRKRQIGFCHLADSMVLENQRVSATSSECESAMENVNINPRESKALESWRLYPCSGSEITYQNDICLNESKFEHQQTHKEKGPDTYLGLGEKPSAISEQQHERTRMRDRPYQCTTCGKSFHHKQVFIRHQKIHTGERPYQCLICGKSFRLKEVLTQHHNIHTGEKPFQCNICGKSFNRKGTLVRHQTIHFKDGIALESLSP
ncbi:uncharacterized protein LOC144755287 [Lissotriton helveticus]